MTDYREILRLDSLGFSKQSIADSCNCARNTAKSVLDAAQVNGINWQGSSTPNNEALRKLLFPNANVVQYRMPDYEQIHKEMQKSGVTLSLLWVEYCEQCRAAGELPYQSTQFNKYYADYVHKESGGVC